MLIPSKSENKSSNKETGRTKLTPIKVKNMSSIKIKMTGEPWSKATEESRKTQIHKVGPHSRKHYR